MIEAEFGIIHTAIRMIRVVRILSPVKQQHRIRGGAKNERTEVGSGDGIVGVGDSGFGKMKRLEPFKSMKSQFEISRFVFYSLLGNKKGSSVTKEGLLFFSTIQN